MQTATPPDLIDNYYQAHKKSRMVAFFLCFLLGPLGLLYASWKAALILLALAISIGMLWPMGGAVFGWIIAMLFAADRVNAYNQRLLADARLRQNRG
jgi:hypothetical protein